MEKFVVDPAWTDKDSRVEKFRELYEHNDFLTAYSMHTDLRMKADPKWAIGRGDEWESHGLLQLEFLIERGMKSHHKLLDVGCGPGRAARRFVPYLNPGKYWGCDISPECLAHASALAVAEGWDSKRPVFIKNGDLDLIPADVPEDDRGGAPFDYVFGHSVFTHLPEEQIDKMVSNAAKLLAVGGQLLFTYKRGDSAERTGLKQFRYSDATFQKIAESHGLKFQALPKVWPASQRTGLITRA